MRIKYLLYIVMALVFFCGCVQPQRYHSLENRVASIEMENNRQRSRQTQKSNTVLTKLQQDLKILEKRIGLNPAISKEEYADLKYTIQNFKGNFQRLEGLIEEINHRFSELNQKDIAGFEKELEQLSNAISKNYEKVIRLEKYMGFEPTIDKKSSVDQEISKELKNNTQETLYNLAKKLFDDGEKENARIQFENFINKYPDSENADNARFWIADSYYSEKWFEKAILEYQIVLEKYPDSNKLAAARLKQGYAFAELGEKANARLILQELLKKHPGTNEARYAKKKLITLK